MNIIIKLPEVITKINCNISEIKYYHIRCFYFHQQMRKYIPQQYLFIKCTLLHVSKSLCHPQGVLHLCLAKLHKFLRLKLLKLHFHKIIKLKYIKILFGRCLVIQQSLFDVIIYCASSVQIFVAAYTILCSQCLCASLACTRQRVTNVKLPEDDIEKSKHVGVYIL